MRYRRARPHHRGLLRQLFDPKIGRHLLDDEGEIVIDEVRRHWVAYLKPMLWAVGAIAVEVLAIFAPIDLAAPLLLTSLGMLCIAGWGVLTEHRDRFVITNMRVFRVNGVLNTHLATVPLARILDISVDTPIQGRLLGFGHFVFESAAQDQGLKDVKYVGRPGERDLTIQRLVARAGLRVRVDWD